MTKEAIFSCTNVLGLLVYLLVLLTFPFSMFFCMKVLMEYERAVVFRLGRTKSNKKPEGPGLIFLLPCLEEMKVVDMRTLTFNIPPQEILTKDSVTVSVDAVVYYRIFNAISSVTNVEDVDRSTRILAQATLRNALGTKTLADILLDRDELSRMMQSTLDEATNVWGVKVERVEIKDVRLPQQLQRAMAAEAEATREAKAKYIAADGERKASYALKEAADQLMQSPTAMKLRYLQSLASISSEKNSVILFPISADLYQIEAN